MGPKREHSFSRGIRKRPAKRSGNEVKRKARFDSTIFSTSETYDGYKKHFMKRTILLGINVDIRLLRELDIEHLFVTLEWLSVVKLIESVYPTLVLHSTPMQRFIL